MLAGCRDPYPITPNTLCHTFKFDIQGVESSKPATAKQSRRGGIHLMPKREFGKPSWHLPEGVVQIWRQRLLPRVEGGRQVACVRC